MNGMDIEKKYIHMNETIKNSPGLRLNELGEKLKLKGNYKTYDRMCKRISLYIS